MRDTFVRTLIEIAKQDKDVLLVTGDLGFGVLKPYWEQLPDQFINIGIDEQNMTGFAAGLSLEGKTVFTYSIGNFPTLRCLEQIRNDCAYHNANVKIVCVGGGFAYGALGMSHHATEDLGVMRALPGVTIFAPADLAEAEASTWAIYKQPGTCYLRLGRGGEPRLHLSPLNKEDVLSAIKCNDGKDAVIFSTGAIADEVIEAIRVLNEKGISIAHYTFPRLKPIDEKTIRECAEKYAYMFTVEEHNVIGGLGSAVAEIVSAVEVDKGKCKAVVKRLGIKDEYCSIVGSQRYLRSKVGIDAKSIFEVIVGVMK
ncbi:MAG: transketolase [Spirochaetae bacterium HGW-Spirochaetae-2]|jgi:transketolase|nr:MAG: transketolase [Spirochaetae bacterium HGW-Spirochaetae-2]